MAGCGRRLFFDFFLLQFLQEIDVCPVCFAEERRKHVPDSLEDQWKLIKDHGFGFLLPDHKDESAVGHNDEAADVAEDVEVAYAADAEDAEDADGAEDADAAEGVAAEATDAAYDADEATMSQAVQSADRTTETADDAAECPTAVEAASRLEKLFAPPAPVSTEDIESDSPSPVPKKRKRGKAAANPVDVAWMIVAAKTFNFWLESQKPPGISRQQALDSRFGMLTFFSTPQTGKLKESGGE